MTVTNFLEHYEIIHRHFYHQTLSIFIRIPQAFTQQVQWTFFVIRHFKYVSVFQKKKASRSFLMLMNAPPLKRWFIHFSSKNLVVLTSTIQAVATWRMSQRNFYIKVASCQGCCVAKCVVFAARFSDVTFGEEGRSKHHPPNLCRVLNAARGCIFREEGLFCGNWSDQHKKNCIRRWFTSLFVQDVFRISAKPFFLLMTNDATTVIIKEHFCHQLNCYWSLIEMEIKMLVRFFKHVL